MFARANASPWPNEPRGLGSSTSYPASISGATNPLPSACGTDAADGPPCTETTSGRGPAGPVVGSSSQPCTSNESLFQCSDRATIGVCAASRCGVNARNAPSRPALRLAAARKDACEKSCSDVTAWSPPQAIPAFQPPSDTDCPSPWNNVAGAAEGRSSATSAIRSSRSTVAARPSLPSSDEPHANDRSVTLAFIPGVRFTGAPPASESRNASPPVEPKSLISPPMNATERPSGDTTGSASCCDAGGL